MVRRNSSSALATSRLVAWNRRSSRFRALLNSEPMYFSNMASVASASRASSSAAWATRIAVRARRLEIGDVLRGHDGAFVDQPAEAGGMDAPGASAPTPRPRTYSSRSSSATCSTAPAIPDSPAARRSGSGARPDRASARLSSASRSASVRPSAKAWNARLRARARAASPIRSSTAAAGMSTSRGPQMGEHRPHDRLAAVRGPGRIGADLQAGAPVGQPEAAQAQAALQFDRMLPAGLVPVRVVGERRRRSTPTWSRDKGEHRLGRPFDRVQTLAGVPQEAELDGEARAG